MRVAVIDIGSNSVRLLVAEVKDGVVIPLKTDLVTTRLGRGIEKKQLLPETIERTEQAVGQFLNEAAPFEPVSILAAATSAVRDAENSSDFVDIIKQKFNLDVNILTGKEEAYLTYKGVLAGLNMESAQTVIIDLGGGSTEFIWCGNGQTNWESVNVGAVRATEGRYGEKKILELLKPVLDSILQVRPEVLVGVGGTVTNLSSISLGLKIYDPSMVHGYNLTFDEVQNILNILSGKTVEERKAIPGLQPERADIIEAGARIVYLIMNYLQIKTMKVSEADILYGLSLDAAQNVERKTGNDYQK